MRSGRIGYQASWLTLALTSITFGMALFTPPLSGPFCEAGCYTYPYHTIVDRFPRDYYWMYSAMVLNLAVVFLYVCIYFATEHEQKVFSTTSLIFASAASFVLNVDYFIQVSVIQPTLLKGEVEGIALLSQFNPHGIFIVLEEFGFIMLTFSFLTLVPVFYKKSKRLSAVFLASFILSALAFSYVTIAYGIQREYRFEVAVISIVWLTLIATSVMLAQFFREYGREFTQQQ